MQSAIAASLIQHVTKLAGGRQRPYAHFAPPGTIVPSEEDNVSFFSGHTALNFALAVSAGSVASERGYELAPGIWATGDARLVPTLLQNLLDNAFKFTSHHTTALVEVGALFTCRTSSVTSLSVSRFPRFSAPSRSATRACCSAGSVRPAPMAAPRETGISPRKTRCQSGSRIPGSSEPALGRKT